MVFRSVRALCIVALAALLGGAGSVHNGRAATSGLVAAYGFNEGSGTALHDSSGNKKRWHDLERVLDDRAIWRCVELQRLEQLGHRTGGTSLAPTTAVTMEAWVKPSNVSAWRAVVAKEQSAAQLSYGLYAGSNAGPAALVNARGENNATGQSRLSVNTWSYVAGVYDGSKLRIYVNGSRVAQTRIVGAIAESDGALRIGGD